VWEAPVGLGEVHAPESNRATVLMGVHALDEESYRRQRGCLPSLFTPER